MRASVRIYLSGSIRKGRQDPRGDDEFWTATDERLIQNLVRPNAVLLNPAKSPIRRNDYFVNYGCDLFLVQTSDVILADLRTEKGIGVGAELMFAYFVKKPVIGWVPTNSYYQRERIEDVFGEDLLDWTHPFVFGLCDYIANNLVQACERINEMCERGEFAKDDYKSPGNAIEAFKRAYDEKLFG